MECCKKTGIISHVLFNSNLEGAGGVNIAWVDVEPGKSQIPHKHSYDQIYIIEGTGMLSIDQETAVVGKGERILIPSGKIHGIKNETEKMLAYISLSAKQP
jgi:quercetin dioxygenase-like cupin family protein